MPCLSCISAGRMLLARCVREQEEAAGPALGEAAAAARSLIAAERPPCLARRPAWPGDLPLRLAKARSFRTEPVLQGARANARPRANLASASAVPVWRAGRRMAFDATLDSPVRSDGRPHAGAAASRCPQLSGGSARGTPSWASLARSAWSSSRRRSVAAAQGFSRLRGPVDDQVKPATVVG